MQINHLDFLRHKIIAGRKQGRDVSAYEKELNKLLTQGVKNRCPIVKDFINRSKARKPPVLKPSLDKRHAKPYQLIKWFLIASTLTAAIVALFCYKS